MSHYYMTEDGRVYLNDPDEPHVLLVTKAELDVAHDCMDVIAAQCADEELKRKKAEWELSVLRQTHAALLSEPTRELDVLRKFRSSLSRKSWWWLWPNMRRREAELMDIQREVLDHIEGLVASYAASERLFAEAKDMFTEAEQMRRGAK